MDEHETTSPRGLLNTINRPAHFLRGAAACGCCRRRRNGPATTAARAASTQNLAYWNLFGGGDGARMVQMEADFARAHPDIAVKSTTLAWGVPYYTKLTTSTVAGKAPDIAILHMSRMPAFAPAGLLTPLDPATLAILRHHAGCLSPQYLEKGPVQRPAVRDPARHASVRDVLQY